jgi:hypothetical protein
LFFLLGATRVKVFSLERHRHKQKHARSRTHPFSKRKHEQKERVID